MATGAVPDRFLAADRSHELTIRSTAGGRVVADLGVDPHVASVLGLALGPAGGDADFVVEEGSTVRSPATRRRVPSTGVPAPA